MPRYTVIIPIVGTTEYEIEADNEEEARDLVFHGEGYHTNTDYNESIDKATWTVERT